MGIHAYEHYIENLKDPEIKKGISKNTIRSQTTCFKSSRKNTKSWRSTS